MIGPVTMPSTFESPYVVVTLISSIPVTAFQITTSPRTRDAPDAFLTLYSYLSNPTSSTCCVRNEFIPETIGLSILPGDILSEAGWYIVSFHDDFSYRWTAPSCVIADYHIYRKP